MLIQSLVEVEDASVDDVEGVLQGDDGFKRSDLMAVAQGPLKR